MSLPPSASSSHQTLVSTVLRSTGDRVSRSTRTLVRTHMAQGPENAIADRMKGRSSVVVVVRGSSTTRRLAQLSSSGADHPSGPDVHPLSLLNSSLRLKSFQTHSLQSGQNICFSRIPPKHPNLHT